MLPSSCPGTAGPAAAALVAGTAADEVALARRARTTLLAAGNGRLVVADGKRASPEALVAVIDDGGEPVLLVPRDGHVVAAAQLRGHAALFVDADPEFGVGVTLVGRLGVGQRWPERSDGPRADVIRDQFDHTDDQVAVALTVERVLVSCPYAELTVNTRTRRPIPLDLYALAEPDRVTVEIVRMIPHLNAEHADDVRALAAFCAAVPATDVLGAQLIHLCRNGFGLWWVGRHGAIEERFRFPDPVRDVPELADRLQSYVGAAPL